MVILPLRNATVSFVRDWYHTTRGFMAQGRQEITATVLVLAGIELIFFTVVSMGLCFGFVLATVLITQGCFCYS